MSATTNFHGPFTASARLVGPGEFTKDPFVTLQISVPGADVSLLRIDAVGLESLSAALGEARVLLESITPPGDEAQRIAEAFDEARAEMDRGL